MEKTERFSGLNENEIRVLKEIREAIRECTGNEFCYSEEVKAPRDNRTDEVMAVNVLNGYLSCLEGKDRIINDEESEQINMIDIDGYMIGEIEKENDWKW